LIAADTSAVLHFLHGFDSTGRRAVRLALQAERLVLPPVVVAELLSTPSPEPELDALLRGATILPVLDGYWERSGLTRRKVLARGLKARLADTLVAQTCIDADIPLIVGDTDFRHFVTLCGLRLQPD
jgi:predicted nucleic acid-binding protein